RNRIDLKGTRRLARDVHRDWIGHAVARGEAPHVVYTFGASALLVTQIDSDDHQALIAELPVSSLERGRLVFAWLAPGAPAIDQHNLAAISAQPYILATQPRQREVWRRLVDLADRRECRLGAAAGEYPDQRDHEQTGRRATKRHQHLAPAEPAAGRSSYRRRSTAEATVV